MNRSDIIKSVRARIDEVATAQNLILDVGIEDNKPIDVIIDEVLDGCILHILSVAPYDILPNKEVVLDAVIKADPAISIAGCSIVKNIAEITVPDHFLRLVSLSLSEWNNPVAELSPINSAIARRQGDIFLRGGIDNPVAIRNNNKIECYSSSSSQDKATLSYIEDITFNGSDCVLDNPKAINALLWDCAGKTLLVLGNSASKMCEDKSMEAIL